MKNKNFFLFAIFLIFTSKLSAETFIFEYSEWSENYPTGVDEWIVESEERYKWTDGEDITEEYYSNYKEGYYKLENDHKTYYRYITNDAVVVDSQNNFVTDLGYCVKEKCYIIKQKNQKYLKSLKSLKHLRLQRNQKVLQHLKLQKNQKNQKKK